jgi:hypothetical protein
MRMIDIFGEQKALAKNINGIIGTCRGVKPS